MFSSKEDLRVTLDMPNSHLAPRDAFEAAFREPHSAFKAHVMDGARVRLEVEVGRPALVSATQILRDGEILAIPTGVEEQGRRLMFFIRPTIIRSETDLLRLFARRTRDRDE